MTKRNLLLSVLLTFYCVLVQANFKSQRVDLFSVLPVNSESIVMIGNSITNGNDWCEAYGNANVLNRGISGNTSGEVLNRLHPILRGKPKAIFLLIGINDGAAAETTVANITAIMDSVRLKSPDTKLYVQSVLPVNSTFSNFGHNQRGALVASINALLPSVCAAKGATFVDVYSEMKTSETNINLNSNYTNDGLHLLGAGYAKWTRVVEELVGEELNLHSQFDSSTYTPISGETYVNQRISAFSALPVNEGDVLMLGDYYINTGEWHELLRNPKVKNRGVGIRSEERRVGKEC